MLLNKLKELVEGQELLTLIQDVEGWNSLNINYHPPIVERVWRQYGEYRLSLHKIHTCEPNEALTHLHTWPASFFVFPGQKYEQNLYTYRERHVTGDILFSKVFSMELFGGYYEMSNPLLAHNVRPLNDNALTIMLSGKKTSEWEYNERYAESFPKLEPLDDSEKLKILIQFEQQIKSYHERF